MRRLCLSGDTPRSWFLLAKMRHLPQHEDVKRCALPDAVLQKSRDVSPLRQSLLAILKIFARRSWRLISFYYARTVARNDRH
jgi:hypothetical protein